MGKLFLLLVIFLQAGGQPVNIPIKNPDFTQGEIGWTFGPGSRVIQFNGIPVAMVGYGSSFHQTVQVPTMPVGIYTLNFDVENYFYWYPGEYTVSLTLSKFYEAPLCSWSAHPLGDFTRVSLACTVRDMAAQALTITFHDTGSQGWESLGTHFSLTFTPSN